jgi:hypothetical protein
MQRPFVAEVLMSTHAASSSTSAANAALTEILKEISVPIEVLKEARRRRNLVLRIAEEHDAARDGAGFPSGSVAHGTTNNPLEDADCGIKVNRRFKEFRVFGPDAAEDRGPESFIRLFSDFVLPRLRRHYPSAEVDLEGNRAIKFLCHETVQIDEWGPVDPYVELIVGLDRADGPGIWIPNRRHGSWDPADPELHTELMTQRDPDALRVLRAHALRLAKRAVKRDAANGGVAVMCSWNLSALGLGLITETGQLGVTFRDFLRGAAADISLRLTEDPAPAVVEPIKLPEGVSQEAASLRLNEMADIVEGALGADTKAGARAHLEALFGPEIEDILAREKRQMNWGLRARDASTVAGVLGAERAPKTTRSGGA